MNILFLGDVVGRAGRVAVCNNLLKIKSLYQIDFTIVNCDNASGGFGISRNAEQELIKAGADVLTGGDHIWDQREVLTFINQSKKLLRPHNFPNSTPGVGYRVFETANSQRILVIHLLGQVFIKYNVNCPFEVAENIVKNHPLKKQVDAIFVDFHAEATSEKMAMGKFLDGKVSAVVGSHTHIPTNDCHIMAQQTAYQTDAGMCGDFDSVIGMDKNVPLQMFIHKRKFDKMEPAKGEATICGCVVEIDNKTGLAQKIFPLKINGILGEQIL
ncbi:MAG: TIGR00282 family metallophosphoesterase [Alphaproteobacteria bacterium]|nr:TIGR00282 family metallophosphoesterase [Alphaproteobacteria bacterium]